MFLLVIELKVVVLIETNKNTKDSCDIISFDYGYTRRLKTCVIA